MAILAKLKGAAYTLAIDNDEWSIENAKENCLKNGCSDIDISIQDISTLANRFDILLANINLNVLLQTMPQLKKMMNPGADLFLSGILFSDIEQISACFTQLGLKLISQKQKKNWVALHLK